METYLLLYLIYTWSWDGKEKKNDGFGFHQDFWQVVKDKATNDLDPIPNQIHHVQLSLQRCVVNLGVYFH